MPNFLQKNIQRRKPRNKPILIFGAAVLAEMAYFYFTFDAKRQVAGFVVDRPYYKSSLFLGLPVVAFDEVVHFFPPEKYEMFVALGPVKQNRIRAAKVAQAVTLGYSLASYISSRAKIGKNVTWGRHVMILEGCVIDDGASLGNDVILQSKSIVGKKAVVKDHVYMYANARVRPQTVVKPYKLLQSLHSLERHEHNLQLNNPSLSTPLTTATNIESLSLRDFAILKAQLAVAFSHVNEAHKKSKTSLRTISIYLDNINFLMNNFIDGVGTKEDFRHYIAGLKNVIPHLPLWLAALYELTSSNLPRWRLLGQSPLMYEGIFADKKELKRLIANSIERALKLPAPKTARTKNNHTVLFTMPNIDVGDTNIVNMAKKFRLIRHFWPDATFHLLVGDDYYFSPMDVMNFWKDLWQQTECTCNMVTPARRHSHASRDYIERIFRDENIDVELFLTDPDDLYEKRMSAALQWAEQLEPGVVLSFSIDSILDTIFYRRFPTVRFSTGEFNAVFPTDADLFVTPHNVKDLIPILLENNLADDIPTYRHVHFPVKALQAQTPVKRKTYRLADDIFYIATISRHFEVGVYHDVCEEIKKFLDRHEKARWLLVGIYKHMARPPSLRHKRIRLIPDCPDGIGMTQLIDVLIPVTPGTGITTLAAMHAGIPVLTVEKRASPFISTHHAFVSDVSTFVGPDLSFPNARDLGVALDRLYSDSAYRTHYSAQHVNRAKHLIRERDAAIDDQFACITDGIAHYQQRILNDKS